MATRRSRRRKREGLIHRHLSRVSRKLLENHSDVVRQFIGKNHGIYALYRRGKLHYVGLASGLASRLKSHRKNKHSDQWDQFSIYLTVKEQHTRELESLFLQIFQPKGNSQRGKLAGSKDMLRAIRRAIREKQNLEVGVLFGSLIGRSSKQLGASEAKVLQKLLPKGARLIGTLKGKKFVARVRRDGRVRYAGEVYGSLSSAAKAALGRPTNGWWFWQVERGSKNWVRLIEIRRAGTTLA